MGILLHLYDRSDPVWNHSGIKIFVTWITSFKIFHIDREADRVPYVRAAAQNPRKNAGKAWNVRNFRHFDILFIVERIFSIIEIWLTVFFICRIIMVIYGKARHV